MAESRNFEDERLLRLWPVAVADRAEDDDAVWAARQLLACNQHGHWSVAVRARLNKLLALSWRGKCKIADDNDLPHSRYTWRGGAKLRM